MSLHLFTERLSISVKCTTIRLVRRSCQIRQSSIRQRAGGGRDERARDNVSIFVITAAFSARWQDLETIRSKRPPVQYGVKQRHERKRGHELTF